MCGEGESCHTTHPHPCICTNVYILQYVNEYTHPTNLVCLGGEGQELEGRSGRGNRGKGGGEGHRRGEGEAWEEEGVGGEETEE